MASWNRKEIYWATDELFQWLIILFSKDEAKLLQATYVWQKYMEHSGKIDREREWQQASRQKKNDLYNCLSLWINFEYFQCG